MSLPGTRSLFYAIAFVGGGCLGVVVAWQIAYEPSLLWLGPLIVCVLAPMNGFKLLNPNAFIPTHALGSAELPISDARFLLIAFVWNGLIACVMFFAVRRFFFSSGLHRDPPARSRYDY
jgi:hypothetical protein